MHPPRQLASGMRGGFCHRFPTRSFPMTTSSDPEIDREIIMAASTTAERMMSSNGAAEP